MGKAQRWAISLLVATIAVAACTTKTVRVSDDDDETAVTTTITDTGTTTTSTGTTTTSTGTTTTSTGTTTGTSTSACFDACADQVSQTSLDLWLGMVGCTYCGACYDVCDGGSGQVCETGQELGCSASSSSCHECVNSDCAQIDQCGGEVDACLADQGCLDFNACYQAC